MTAATTSTKVSPMDEIIEPLKIGLSGIDKKIRNLEKKKSKLDTLREDVKKSGKPLNEDQSQALARYEDIVLQLETFRELQKQFQNCSSDIQKCYKKNLRKEQQAEIYRLYEFERYRAVARIFEDDEVLKGFAEDVTEVLSTEKNGHLKILRKILLPVRSDFSQNDALKSFEEYLKLIAEQQSNLLNGRAVQLGDTLISEAKEFLDRVVGSKFLTIHPELLYFTHSPKFSVQENRRQNVLDQTSSFSQLPIHPLSVSQVVEPPESVLSSSVSAAGASPDYQYGISFTNSKMNTPNVPIPVILPNPDHHSDLNARVQAVVSQVPAPVNAIQNPITVDPLSILSRQPVQPYSHDRIPLQNGAVAQGQNAWDTQRSFGTFDASKPNGSDFSKSTDVSHNQENQDGGRSNEFGRNGNFGGASRGRGRGRGSYDNNRERRSFDDGRRGGYRGDRGGFRNGRPVPGSGSGRLMGEHRGPRGDFESNGDGDDEVPVKGGNPGGVEPSDNDFGYFHVDNPSYRGRTSYDDRRGLRRDNRAAPRNGPIREGRGVNASNGNDN